MSYRIEDFQTDPNWIPSLGEKPGKIHYRNKNFHAEIDPKTGYGDIHYDEIDPYESPTSLVKHMWQSSIGKGILLIGGLAILDHIFNNDNIRKSIF